MKIQKFSLMITASAVYWLLLSSFSSVFIESLTYPLSDEAWKQSEWLSVADEDNQDRPTESSSWFVSNIKPSQKVKNAKWMTAGLGVYKLYVNGEIIGKEMLRPGFTTPEQTKRSFTYVISDRRKLQSENGITLAVEVTPGWWTDRIVRQQGWEKRRCAFRGVLEVTYDDGSTEYFPTNVRDWKAGVVGPIIRSGIYEGESYDARQPLGFNQIDKFGKPVVNQNFNGSVLPSDGAEIYLRTDLTLQVKEAYVWKDVEGAKEGEFGKVVVARSYQSGKDIVLDKGETLVVDFGQNCAAVPSFVFKAEEGTMLTCLPAELLNDGNGSRSRGMDGPEGSCHRENLRMQRDGMRIEYIFADCQGKYVSYQPTTTFFGYRYISVTATDKVTFQSITSIPVTSITHTMEWLNPSDRMLKMYKANNYKLRTGNASVNQLISNTYWGMLSNYLSVPTDCPQRNERLGWMADTQVFAETGTFFADTRRFMHKWLRDVRDCQGEKGGYTGVAPLGPYGSEKMRVGWADAGVIVPWVVWKQYGDTEIINEHWESMERFMNHVSATKYRHELMLDENFNYQWADWLSYEPLESCGGGAFAVGKPLPEAVEYWNYLSGCYWQNDAEMMADMAEASGRDAGKYRDMAQTAKTYLKETFLNSDGTFKTSILNTMQTPALFALKNHLVEGDAKAAVIARLKENFAAHEGCLQTGFLGTSILMSTLTENGLTDIAYDLLFQRKNPSWLYSVDNGATTMWERWNSYMADKGMGPNGMNSFNHYAYGCVCEWIWKTAAGIAADPRQPGFRHIIMRPIPDRRLGSLDAYYPSAAGIIKSSWKYKGDKWIWEFFIPRGATASVTLPGETMAKEYQSGKHKVEITL